MKLIVGLGNPGKEYDNTRHNVGYMCIDNYLENQKWQEKFNSLFFQTIINGEKVVFIKPTTYMNNSGIAVKEVKDYFKISLEDILVIQDDLDLEVGKLKIKVNSSDGGHNGIKSIINCLGSNNFARLKIGISNDKKADTKEYVLSKFSKQERIIIDEKIALSKNIIDDFVSYSIERVMSFYNNK